MGMLCGELVVDWTANCISFQSSILKMGCCSGSEPTRIREYGILPTLPENVHALDLPISPTTNQCILWRQIGGKVVVEAIMYGEKSKDIKHH